MFRINILIHYLQPELLYQLFFHLNEIDLKDLCIVGLDLIIVAHVVGNELKLFCDFI